MSLPCLRSLGIDRIHRNESFSAESRDALPPDASLATRSESAEESSGGAGTARPWITVSTLWSGRGFRHPQCCRKISAFSGFLRIAEPPRRVTVLDLKASFEGS